MSKSLAERLQEKLEDQTAEIAALTDSELRKLSTHVQSSVNEELSDIRNVINYQLNEISYDLPRLTWALSLTWGALILSLMLTSFLLWQPTRSPTTLIAPELFETFRYEGQSYLMVPPEVEPLSCKNRQGLETMCFQIQQGS